jgi:signal transduction histidine kinase
MSIEAVIMISCSFAITALAALVLIRNPKGGNNRRFALLSFSLVGWTVFNYLSDTTIPVKRSLLYTRLTFFFGVAAIFCLLRFIANFPNENIFKKSLLLKIYKIWSLLLLPITLTPLFISSVVSIPAPQIQTAQLYPIFIAYLVYSICVLPLITFRQFKATNIAIEKQQLLIITWGITFYAILATISNVVLPLVFNNWSSSRIGPIFTFALVGVVAYSIVKHKLFDIRLVIARSLAYVLLLTTLAGVYAAAFLSISKLFFVNSDASTGQNITSIVLAVILAGTFQPFKKFFVKATDRFFFRDHYDPQLLLGNLGSIMNHEIELARLTKNVIGGLADQMKISVARIIVLDENKIFYEANQDQRINVDKLTALGQGVVVKDSFEPGTAPELFNDYDLSAAVELRSTNELVGYLLLGQKKSGEIYNATDVKTLGILAQELAIAIHNAKSYTQIQNFNKTLQKRIDEATQQLRDANEHLKQLDEIKNEFLSMATHQLNTPLTVVDGYLGMIIDNANVNNDLPEQDREYIKKSMHRVHLMKRLVSDFLNVSRIESGTFVIEAAPVDMNRLISEEVNGLGLAAKEKGVLLRYFPPKHPVPVIEVDEQKTRQAVMNLIDNAIYYAPKGDVKVFLESDEQNVTFKVVDNGIGVPESYKSKLFAKFSRADNAKEKRPNGTGVGLYLVKRVVDDQGGQIVFESTEGQGSTFGFILPIKSKAEEISKPAEPEPAALNA